MKSLKSIFKKVLALELSFKRRSRMNIKFKTEYHVSVHDPKLPNQANKFSHAMKFIIIMYVMLVLVFIIHEA